VTLNIDVGRGARAARFTAPRDARRGGGAAVASGASFIVPSTNRSHVKSGLVQKLNVPKKTTPRNNGDEEPPRGSKKSRRLIRR